MGKLSKSTKAWLLLALFPAIIIIFIAYGGLTSTLTANLCEEVNSNKTNFNILSEIRTPDGFARNDEIPKTGKLAYSYPYPIGLICVVTVRDGEIIDVTLFD